MLIKRFFYKFSLSNFNAAKDYYQILGISMSADAKIIKKSFRDLAKKYHPDSSTGNQNKFKQINQAYQVLSTDDVKRQYDQARKYSSKASGNYSSNPNYNSSQQNGYQSGYQNNQYNANQSYQGNSQSNQQYRGYTRSDGWQNQRYRDNIMNQMYKQYQSKMNQQQTRNDRPYSNPSSSSFGDSYQRHSQHIRQYTEELRRRQVNRRDVENAFMEEEERRQREYRNFQEKEVNQYKMKMEKKINDMKDGIVKNVHGFIKVADFLKSTWNDITKKK